MRRSLKIRGRRKEKEKLPSGITADYSASFFAQLDRDVLDEAGSQHHHASFNSSVHHQIRTPEGLTQSDSSEASLTSLTNSGGGGGGKNLPPLPPKPPKRGILKGPRLSVGSVGSAGSGSGGGGGGGNGGGSGSGGSSAPNNLVEPGVVAPQAQVLQNGANPDNNHLENNLLVRNTLQNEVIAYQNLPLQRRDELQLIYSEEEGYQVRRSPQQSHHQFGHPGQQDTKLLHVSLLF